MSCFVVVITRFMCVLYVFAVLICFPFDYLYLFNAEAFKVYFVLNYINQSTVYLPCNRARPIYIPSASRRAFVLS